MQQGKQLSIGILSLLAAACGGPDIDKVKADFESPSGSTQNKDAVVAANSKRDGSAGVMALGAGGVPGNGLTAARPRGFASANVMRAWAPRAEALRDAVYGAEGTHVAHQGLLGGPTACDNSAEAKAAYEELFQDAVLSALNPLGGGGFSGSASYKQDLSSCSEGELTGVAEIEIELEADEGYFRFALTYSLDNVCETAGDMACLTGDMIMEAEIEGNDQMGALQFTTAWKVDGAWNDGGTRREASLQGGVRLAASGNNTGTGMLAIQYLIYVVTPDGDEYSYVWELEASGDGMGNGMVTWRCRGNDGSIECTVNNEGGMCHAEGNAGQATVSWDAAYEAGQSEEWYGD